MKKLPFNIDLALTGMYRCETRDGRKVTGLVWYKSILYHKRIIGLVNNRHLQLWTENGCNYTDGIESLDDLILIQVHNPIIYRGNEYPTRFIGNMCIGQESLMKKVYKSDPDNALNQPVAYWCTPEEWKLPPAELAMVLKLSK
jgi:hypothetical protein